MSVEEEPPDAAPRPYAHANFSRGHAGNRDKDKVDRRERGFELWSVEEKQAKAQQLAEAERVLAAARAALGAAGVAAADTMTAALAASAAARAQAHAPGPPAAPPPIPADAILDAAERARVVAWAAAGQAVAKLQHALLVQQHTLDASVAMSRAPARCYTIADINARLECVTAAFEHKLFLMSQLAPRRQLLENKRLRNREMQACVNVATTFRSKTAEVGGRVRPTVLIVGDWALSRKAQGSGFAFKRLLQLLAKTFIVIVVREFRTSCLCHFCGGGVQHPKPGKGRCDFRGTVHCNDSNCVSRGLFKNRDTAAACNIGCRFVYDFFLGGYLGGFSECELLTNGQPRPEMRIGFFQIFRPL